MNQSVDDASCVCASLVLTFFFVCLCNIGCADQLLLFPTTAPASFGDAQRRLIDNPGRQIEVFTAKSPGAESHAMVDAYALEFTGNATRAEYVVNSIATRWGDRPVEVWVMNYPGFGQTTGPANLHDIPADALATYDALAKEANGKPIFVCGASLGTSTALYVAANRPCAGMILQNPPPLQRMILQKYGWVAPAPVVAQIPEELDSLANAKRVKVPAVFVLAGRTYRPAGVSEDGRRSVLRGKASGANAPCQSQFADRR